MGNIYCLMGKSASGKDTIYNRLLAMEELHLRCVVPYTTRPMRSGETDGQTYFFCTEQQVAEFEAAGKIIELRAYNTVYGIWKYFTADDGQICLAESDYLMIGTLEAYEQIRDYFGADKVCPVYVEVNDGLRLQRAWIGNACRNSPNMRRCAAGFWRMSRIFPRKSGKSRDHEAIL